MDLNKAKPYLFGGLGTLVILAGVGMAGSMMQPRVIVQTGPLLQRVQELGDLHTVKYTYRDVHNFETQQEPSGPLASFPGVSNVVHAATRNAALMSFTGTVEAGVDLSRAKVEKTATGLRIQLPNAKVYTPNIDADVHSLQRTVFWKDDSITVDAISDAKTRVVEACIQQGILRDAKKNAKARVESLAKELGAKGVEVVFADEMPAKPTMPRA